jgi:dienelactone hydrolase
MKHSIAALLLLVLGSLPLQAAELAVRHGDAEFAPAATETELPDLFRLAERKFSFEQVPQRTISRKIAISDVRFPSPVETPHVNNNTVHCEYFRPAAQGKYPGVIVLHILGGDFDLARLFARSLAHKGVGALFLKMPYYGPRQQPGVDVRMISLDPEVTVAGMRQAVLDIRCARAWLLAQEEIDPAQTGVFGISLGGITAGLAASAEPRFNNVCMMLAGGGIGQVTWDNPEMSKAREYWLAKGGTRETFCEILKRIDPAEYARPVEGRRMLMLNAQHDEVIPPSCTDALWKAFGKPEIHWYDAGHYSALRYIDDGAHRVTTFFSERAQN